MRLLHLTLVSLVAASGCKQLLGFDDPLGSIPDDGGGDGGGCAGSESVDADGDGVSVCAGDCDDSDALVSPMVNELCGDGVDNDCDMIAESGCMGLGTFVSAAIGDDTYPGTKVSPVRSITKGMANGVLIGTSQSVIVAEGSYAEKIALVEGIDLMGGFACTGGSCTWVRDPLAHPSTITNIDFEGVLAGDSITRATLVDGFTITGLDGSVPATGSAGVTLAGGTPTIRNNTIVGGNAAAGSPFARSLGLLLRWTTDPAGALIDGNTLLGGPSVGLSSGLSFDSSPGPRRESFATVTNNVIRGGAAQSSVAVSAWTGGQGTVIAQNDIMSGTASQRSCGVEVASALLLDRNTINTDRSLVGVCGGTGSQWCSGITSWGNYGDPSATATITNNVIFGPRGARTTAVHLVEAEVQASTVVLNGNYLDGGGNGNAGTTSAAIVVVIGGCSSCGFRAYIGRTRNNVLGAGDNELRFGVLEAPAAGRATRIEILENNLFWFTPGGLHSDVAYRQVASTGSVIDHLTAAAVNAIVAFPASANLAGDPMLDATSHIAAASPCVNAGTSMEAPAADFDGEPRPNGAAVDIGHDER